MSSALDAAAASANHRISEVSAVRCPCCGSAFEDVLEQGSPSLFECGHAVCGACAAQSASKPKLACPYCHAACSVPAAPAPVIASYAASASGEAQSSIATAPSVLSPPSLFCEDCKRDGEDSVALFRCVELDGRPVCELHATVHSHKRRRLEPVAASAHSLIYASKRCRTHVTCELNHFCMTDMVAVCPECVIYEHPLPGHNVLRLTAAIEELGGMVSMLLTTH